VDRSFFRFVTMHAFDRQRDGWTDRILITRPRLHSMQRVENELTLKLKIWFTSLTEILSFYYHQLFITCKETLTLEKNSFRKCTASDLFGHKSLLIMP